MEALKKNLKNIKSIITTYIVIALSVIFGVSIVRWLLSMQTNILFLENKYWEFWIPMILSGVLVYIILNKKYNTIKDLKEKPKDFALTISWLAIIFCCFISKDNLIKLVSKSKEVDNIYSISNNNTIRYYQIDSFRINEDVVSVNNEFYKPFRWSRSSSVYEDVYFVFPIINPTELTNPTPRYWFGVTYTNILNNGWAIPDEEKQEKIDAFHRECESKIRNYSFLGFNQFEKLPPSRHKNNYIKAIEKIYPDSNKDFIILEKAEKKASLLDIEITVPLLILFISLVIKLFILSYNKYRKPEA